MNALAEAQKLYAPHGLSVEADLANYLQFGYVFAEPGRLLLGRPCVTTRPNDWVSGEEADGWYVRLAVGRGCVKWFIDKMPFLLPWVCWHRNFRGDGKLHLHSTSRTVSTISRFNNKA